MEVIRAAELWQRAGAYYVRIQAMARQYNITLDKEFDEYDGPDTKYIVILDDSFPVATCRILDRGEKTAEIGRVVLLEEYRGRGLGAFTVFEAEKWICELGFERVLVESRVEVTGFYEKLGYSYTGTQPKKGDTFVCVSMEKTL